MIDIGWKQERIKEIKDILKMDKELLGDEDIDLDPERESANKALKDEIKTLTAEILVDLKEIEAEIVQDSVDVLERAITVSLAAHAKAEDKEVDENAFDEMVTKAPALVQKAMGVKKKTRRTREQITAFWSEKFNRVRVNWKDIPSVAVLLRVMGDERGWKITRERSANKILGHYEFNMLRDYLTINRGV